MMKAIDNTKVITAEEVARAIVRGIVRRRYVVISGSEAKFLFWLAGLLGPATYRAVDLMVRRACQKVETTRN